MKALKFFNILLFALILTMITQIWMAPKVTPIAENSIALTTTADSVTVPNIPQITVHNTKTEDFAFNTCEHLSLVYSPATSANTIAFPSENCQEITVKAGSSHLLDLSFLHTSLSKLHGKYELKLSSGDIERKIDFSVERPGFFKTMATTLVYDPIYNLLVGLLLIVPDHSLGWAIVAITIIIRLILLYPQHQMLVNAKKLAALNPKIRALQEEYSSDRATLGMKMMELYKKENVNPMGSCLPLLIQFPILIALYWVIMGITKPENTYHLYAFFQNFSPENIQTIFFGQNLLAIGGMVAIVAAIVLTLTQFLQSWLSLKNQPPLPKADANKPKNPDEMPTIDPRFMQGMTLYFLPLVIGISALFFPIGLALYWWIGIIFMICQQFYVNARAENDKKKGEIIKKK